LVCCTKKNLATLVEFRDKRKWQMFGEPESANGAECLKKRLMILLTSLLRKFIHGWKKEK
jgi:hypothetical protein